MWKIEKFVEQEHLNILDEEFVIRVYKDIDGYLNEKLNKCVLIFPPLNNRRRYFIHKVAKLFNVETFSVGEGVRRLTVVCASEINKKKVNEEEKVMDKSECKKGAISKIRRSSRPDAPIYIPPAIRKVQYSQLPNKNDKPQSSFKQSSRQKDNNDSVIFTEIKNDVNNKPDCNVNQLKNETESEINVKNNITSIDEFNFNVPETNVITLNSEEIETAKDADKSFTTNRICTDEIKTKNNGNIENSQDSNVIEINIECNDNEHLNNDNNKDDKKQLWKNKDNDQEQEELFRASEEINRKNKRIMKQSFSNNSDVLIISNHTKSNNQKTESASEPVDCWEDLLDGGQLDSDLMLQIIDQVGNVSITTTKEDYSEFKEKTCLEGDFAHILEIYDFPKEFQTRDLVSILDSFKTGTYHIKWVDDNHALGVFSSGFITTELLKISHPLLKLRPMYEASKQSIAKALRYPNAMAPSATRPKTCPQTARRMVTGALGLKLSNAKEERAKEIRILKEAREKKKLLAKQQDDAWEGKPSSS